MGRELCQAALARDGIELVGGTEGPGAPEIDADLGELCGAGKIGVVLTEDRRSSGRRDWAKSSARRFKKPQRMYPSCSPRT
jgi:dihydrodipicolinate reductase